MMHTIAVTRFNDSTWEENLYWREKQKFQGCVYNSPAVIAGGIPIHKPIFVLEMNNSTRKIQGIGLIHNRIRPKRVKIYKDDFYNRFTYYSKYRIDRSILTVEEIKIITILEELVFYGSSHLQRGRGIQKIPEAILQCQCILRALGENLQQRGNIVLVNDRLKEKGIDTEWIQSNRGIYIVTWLLSLFRRQFVDMSTCLSNSHSP